MKKRIDLNYNKIINIKNILILIFSISCALLSVYLMIGKINNIFKIVTFFSTLVLSSYYFKKNYNKIIKLIKENKMITIISFILSIIILYEFIVNVKNIDIIRRILNIKEIYLFSIFGLFIIITIVSIKIRDWISKFIREMDIFEKRVYIISSILVFILILFMYQNKINFYHEYDVVYSIDSGKVYDIYMPDPHYYDIRHPLTSILTFPVYAIVDFVCSDNLKPIILQFINVQLLIFIGLELKRLTNNKWVYVFYILSFTSLIYILFLEKYILSVFLMVTYIYNIFINKKDIDILLIFSVGTLPTNLYIIVSEFCKKIKTLNKFQNVTKILFLGIIMIVLTGRLPFIKTAFIDIFRNSGYYGTENYTLINKFNSTSKMIEHAFIALPSGEHVLMSVDSFEYESWIWDDVTKSISYVGNLVILVILVGIIDIIKTKKLIFYPFISSFVFSFILFIIIGWDVGEAPLFTICFSWSIISLFVYSLEKIFKLLRFKTEYYKYVYLSILILMTIINIPEIINIYNYIK